MNRHSNPSLVLFGLFLCLGSVLIAFARHPEHFAAGGIYMLCSLAFAVLG